MSAFLALAYSDRVELLTDGAVYTYDGTLTDIRRKVWSADSLPMAVTGRGGMEAVEAFASLIRLVASFSATVDDALARLSETFERRTQAGMQQDVEITIACISESRGPLVLYLATADVWGTGIEPWTLVETGGNIAGGPPTDASDLDASAGLAGIGAEIFERMRRVTGPNPTRPDLPDIFGIGGHVDLTVVRAEGVTTERLWTWSEDAVGEKIRPSFMG